MSADVDVLKGIAEAIERAFEQSLTSYHRWFEQHDSEDHRMYALEADALRRRAEGHALDLAHVHIWTRGRYGTPYDDLVARVDAVATEAKAATGD